MLKKLKSLLSHDLAIDLGTENICIATNNSDEILVHDKSTIAIEIDKNNQEKLKAVG